MPGTRGPNPQQPHQPDIDPRIRAELDALQSNDTALSKEVQRNENDQALLNRSVRAELDSLLENSEKLAGRVRILEAQIKQEPIQEKKWWKR